MCTLSTFVMVATSQQLQADQQQGELVCRFASASRGGTVASIQYYNLTAVFLFCSCSWTFVLGYGFVGYRQFVRNASSSSRVGAESFTLLRLVFFQFMLDGSEFCLIVMSEFVNPLEVQLPRLIVSSITRFLSLIISLIIVHKVLTKSQVVVKRRSAHSHLDGHERWMSRDARQYDGSIVTDAMPHRGTGEITSARNPDLHSAVPNSSDHILWR